MVAIITLNFNQNNFTIKCIESLLLSEYKDYQIILIDNGSSSDNYKKLKERLPDDRRVTLKRLDVNKGYVGGVNYGLDQGLKLNPQYFMIMNNDTIIDKNAIQELVKSCKNFEKQINSNREGVLL